MNFRKWNITLLVGLIVLSLAACAPAAQEAEVPVTGGTSIPLPASIPTGLPAQLVQDAQQWLAQQLSVAVEQVQLVEVEQAEWTDSCLGLGQPNESCLQAMTPGWRVVFEINGQRHEVRTDQTGSAIRLATP